MPSGNAPSTLLLSRSVIAGLAGTRDYLDAMQRAFTGLAEQRYRLPEVQHLPGEGGAFHVKSAARLDRPALAVVKINGNFPGNSAAHGLPTIQGTIVLFDAERGCVLAIMDSIEITARRTAAATALAARHLARSGSQTLGIVGCGAQARYHVEALRDVAPLETISFYDSRDDAARAFEAWVRTQGLESRRAVDARSAARGAEIVVTVTTSTTPVLALDDVAQGTFVAGVGADNPSKHELAPDLLAASRVVVDSCAQAAMGGDLYHAIESGAMTIQDVYAELAEVVSGATPGRSLVDEPYVFDSTGLAVQDHAAAEMIYERARAQAGLPSIRFDDAAS
jgi:ornithine cyclodeaminase/alanine dehydrogenase-like protein (mu-crystallin family)